MIWKPAPDMGVAKALHQFPPSFLWGSSAAAFPPGLPLSPDHVLGRVNPHGNPITGGCDGDYQGGTEHLSGSVERGAQMHQNALKFPLDWSALQPEEGIWDQTVGQFYQDLFAEALESGIMPLVSLFQGKLPHWFLNQGGWMADASVRFFSQYVSRAADWFSDSVSDWITLESPLHYAYLAAQRGLIHPETENSSTFSTLLEHMMKAHESAYDILHNRRSDSHVSFSTWYWPALSGCRDGKHSRSIRKWLQSAEEIISSGRSHSTLMRVNVESAFRARDFVGINFSSMGFLSDSGRLEACEPKGELLRDPAGLTGVIRQNTESLKRALSWSREFSLPVYLTRHTIFTTNERLRNLLLFSTIRDVWSCVNESWPVRGYFYNNPAAYLDPVDGMSRTRGHSTLNTASGEVETHSPEMLYMEICRQRGVSSGTAKEFTPDLLDHYFPGRGPRDLSMVGG
jgi:beta-glucosidase